MNDGMTAYVKLSLDIVPGEYARMIQVDGNGHFLAQHFRSGHKAIYTKGLEPIYPIDEAREVLKEVLDDPSRKFPEEHYRLDSVKYVDEKRLEFLQSEVFDTPRKPDIFNPSDK